MYKVLNIKIDMKTSTHTVSNFSLEYMLYTCVKCEGF